MGTSEGGIKQIDSGIQETPIIPLENGETNNKELSVAYIGKVMDVVEYLQNLSIPENHIVHEIPGNISINMKYLLFTWEKKNSGWIKETFLSIKKKIRFYGNTIKIGETIIEQGVILEPSNMPSASFMPGNTFDEKRKNLELLLKTFQSS